MIRSERDFVAICANVLILGPVFKAFRSEVACYLKHTLNSSKKYVFFNLCLYMCREKRDGIFGKMLIDVDKICEYIFTALYFFIFLFVIFHNKERNFYLCKKRIAAIKIV